MSKRAATKDVALKPIKLVKGANVWSIIPDDDDEKSKEFKPVEGGPKTKLPKTFILNYKPRMDVTIAINGVFPEVRFAGTDGVFYMSGDEFLDLSGAPQSSRSLDMVRLEPTEDDGFRLARYQPTETGMPALFPVNVLEMNKFAAKRLKSKLEDMCEHVNAIRESEEVIRIMFDCVVDTYMAEYGLTNALTPPNVQFNSLLRVVGTYIPAVVIVRAFLEKMFERRLLSKFNHYNLCMLVLSQIDFLLELVQNK